MPNVAKTGWAAKHVLVSLQAWNSAETSAKDEVMQGGEAGLLGLCACHACQQSSSRQGQT